MYHLKFKTIRFVARFGVDIEPTVFTA